MYSRFHERFGIPGVISCVAIVFAMTGGAYAVSEKIDQRQGETVKCKAKIKGKKADVTCPTDQLAGAAGVQGPAGAQGPAGPAGNNGAAGANGSQGIQGVQGDPWTAGGTLPVGATQTGAWSGNGTTADGLGYLVNISFQIPLASALDSSHALFEGEASFVTHCTGTTQNPAADSGYLCVYVGGGGAPFNSSLKDFGGGAGVYNLSLSQDRGASKSGAVMGFDVSADPAFAIGSWAVTG